MNAQALLNQPQSESSELANMVDELANLHQQVKTFEPIQKRYDELKKLLACLADDFSPDAEARLAGRSGYVVFTKPPATRTIKDVTAFFDAVSVDDFLNCVSVSTTKADKVLNAKQKAALFETSPGARRLKDCGVIGGLTIVK